MWVSFQTWGSSQDSAFDGGFRLTASRRTSFWLAICGCMFRDQRQLAWTACRYSVLRQIPIRQVRNSPCGCHARREEEGQFVCSLVNCSTVRLANSGAMSGLLRCWRGGGRNSATIRCVENHRPCRNVCPSPRLSTYQVLVPAPEDRCGVPCRRHYSSLRGHSFLCSWSSRNLTKSLLSIRDFGCQRHSLTGSVDYLARHPRTTPSGI